MSSARLMIAGAFGGFSGIQEIENDLLSIGIKNQISSNAELYAESRKEKGLLKALQEQHGAEIGSERFLEYFAVESGILGEILCNVSSSKTKSQYEREAVQVHREVTALRREYGR